ncbi:hypothetical protein [Pseudomonas sp. SBB6]|nr:hypothetical protein [Pseudomonas sp. SBB6]
MSPEDSMLNHTGPIQPLVGIKTLLLERELGRGSFGSKAAGRA